MCAKCDMKEKLFKDFSAKLSSLWSILFDEDMAVVVVSESVSLATSTGDETSGQKMLRKAAGRLLEIADNGPTEHDTLSSDDLEAEIHNLLNGQEGK